MARRRGLHDSYMLNAGWKRRRNGMQRAQRREEQGGDEEEDGAHGDLLIWMVHGLFTARVVMTAGKLVLGEGAGGRPRQDSHGYLATNSSMSR
jgi:hypothetical protein